VCRLRGRKLPRRCNRRRPKPDAPSRFVGVHDDDNGGDRCNTDNDSRPMLLLLRLGRRRPSQRQDLAKALARTTSTSRSDDVHCVRAGISSCGHGPFPSAIEVCSYFRSPHVATKAYGAKVPTRNIECFSRFHGLSLLETITIHSSLDTYDAATQIYRRHTYGIYVWKGTVNEFWMFETCDEWYMEQLTHFETGDRKQRTRGRPPHGRNEESIVKTSTIIHHHHGPRQLATAGGDDSGSPQ
jgi:hypothetical protein